MWTVEIHDYNGEVEIHKEFKSLVKAKTWFFAQLEEYSRITLKDSMGYHCFILEGYEVGIKVELSAIEK